MIRDSGGGASGGGGRALVWRVLGAPLMRISPHPAYAFRNAVLRAFGADVARSARVRRSAAIERPWFVSVGEKSIIGDGAELSGRGRVTIGRRCTVSQLVHLATERLTCSGKTEVPEPVVADIVVEDDAWIAADSLVLPGSVVRRESLVGARSVVDGEAPAGMICAGEPARPRRERGLRRTAGASGA